jgi:hypothetical protein
MIKQRIHWWSGKVHRKAGHWFGSAVGQWAVQILRSFSQARVRTGSYRIRLQDLHIPPKYRARALHLLTRFDLVTVCAGRPVTLVLNVAALARSKNTAQVNRRFLSLAERRSIKTQDRFICGECGKRFSEQNLEIDHIVPLSFAGADKPGNLVSLCRAHNRAKRDTFCRTKLRYYRGQRVIRPVGVRYRDRYFWPVINGRVCREGAAEGRVRVSAA